MVDTISTPSSKDVPNAVIGDANPVRTFIQSLAMQEAAKVGMMLGDGVLAHITNQIYGTMSLAERMSGSFGDMGRITALVHQALDIGKPINLSAATPQQLAGLRAAGELSGRFGPGAGSVPLNLRGDNAAPGGSSGDVKSSGGQPLGYSMLSYESPQSLMRLNPTTFASTPFATQDHLNFDTFKMLRGYQFKGSEIHGGVQDAKEIFGPKLDVNSGDGPAIVRDTAGLRHEAPKEAAHIIETMKAKKQIADSDPEVKHAADDIVATQPDSDEERKGFERMRERMHQADVASGAGASVANPALSPAAKGYASDLSARVEHAAARAAILLSAKQRGMTPAQAEQRAARWEGWRLTHGGPPTLPVPASGKPAPAPAKAGEKHAALPATPSKQVAELDQAGKVLSQVTNQKMAAKAADAKVAQDVEQKASGKDVKTAAKTAAQDEVFASLDADKHEPETKSPVVAKAEAAKPADANGHNQAKPGPAKVAAKSASPAKTHTATLVSKAKPSQLKA